MRLSASEIDALRCALGSLCWSHVWLFGSRVDDGRRGGDVDILVYADQPGFAVAHELASRYAAAIDGRLDVLALDPQGMTEAKQ